MIKQKLKRIIEETDTKAGKAFNLSIQALILLSLLAFSIETLPDLEEQTRFYLRIFEIITVVIFTIEYVLRILVADKRLSFIFSFYGIIDLCAILPFYITTGIDLRSIRIFRMFRLFRIFKILRYSNALNRFKNAILLVKEELILFIVVTFFLLFVSSVGIYYFEGNVQPEQFSSVFHCMWWAIITLTTVGYGDVYPITVGGKIFTSIIVLIGLGIVAIPAGLFASALTKTFKDEDM